VIYSLANINPNLRVLPNKFDRKRIHELFGMGGWTVINQIGSLLFLNIDLIVANTYWVQNWLENMGLFLFFLHC